MPTGPAAGKKIDELLEVFGDWRADQIADIRRLVHEAVPDVVVTWKWIGSPVWEKDGILLVGNAHQQKVKSTFPHGAQLSDPEQVFTNGLDGKSWRAIDLHQGDVLDASSFQAPVKAAASHNVVQLPRGRSHPAGAGRRTAEGSADPQHRKGARA